MNVQRFAYALIKLLLLSGVVFSLAAACTPARPVAVGAQLAGRPVQQITIVVPSPFSFTPGLVSHTLPAGRYTPALEDDEGIYFQSPSKITVGDLLGNTFHDGGLYLKKDGSREMYEWLIIRERQSPKFKLPPSFQYSVE